MSTTKTINGDYAIRKSFKDYFGYYIWQKENTKLVYENKVRPEIQFLAERYHEIPDDEISVPKLTNYYIDIEVNAQKGFPDPMEANDPITLISLKNDKIGKVISFGIKPYTGDRDDVIFHFCVNEKEILRQFFYYLREKPCDVYSGYNIINFDIPYIINRAKLLFGERSDIYRHMSPIDKVKVWTDKYNTTQVDIAGSTVLDYYILYKKYSPNKLEMYTLDFVSKFELGVGKLDYSEYGSLSNLYDQNWNKYVDYNIIDCQRVHDLENKLGFIRLVQSLSILSKAPMKFFSAMTQLIEGYLLTHYRRHDLCAPYFAGGIQERFPAAHVKEPLKGMHTWVIDIDITSSYPSHIIALNMSVETYIGRIMGIKESQVVYYTKNRNFPSFDMYKDSTGITKICAQKLRSFNMALEKGLIAIAPCGSVFSTNEPGIISDVERNVFAKRKEVKNRMKKMRYEASQMEDCDAKIEKEIRAQELYSLQWALKIWINSVFGILAVPYSRYFNTNIAEAITSCGRHTIKRSEQFVNEYYRNKELVGLPSDFVAYIDTDSLFIRLGSYFEVFDENWNDKSDEEKIELIKQEARRIEEYVNKRTFDEVQKLEYNSQVDDFKIGFKQEIIAKSAIFIKKKKYAYWCLNEEGTPCDKMSVTGLEIVRSDSSEAVRPKLKHIMEMVLKQEDDSKIIGFINKYRKELIKLKPEDLAANIGVNNLKKYIVNGKPTKGTPWHVKGVANYANLLKALDIEDKYEHIEEGMKAKVVYLSKNQFNFDTMTFYIWPPEFDKVLQFDKKTMVDKFFINKIKTILDPINKEYLINGDVKQKLGLFFN